MTYNFKDAESGKYVVEAGKSLTLNITGTFVRCLASNGDLQISINDGAECFFATGIKRSIPDMLDENGNQIEFKKVTLANNGNADVTVTIAYGYGDVEDTRFSVAGALPIENKAGEIIDVGLEYSNGSGGTKLARVFDANLADVRNLLMGFPEANNYLPKGFLDLRGYDFFEAKGSTTTIVTSAQNTGGYLIKLVSVANITTGGKCQLLINDKDHMLLGFGFSSSGGILSPPSNIIVPAGQSVKIKSTNSSSHIVAYGKDL